VTRRPGLPVKEIKKMSNLTSCATCGRASNAVSDAILAIGSIDNLADLKLVSKEVHSRWMVLSRVTAATAAVQFNVGDKVRLRRRGITGVITKFGPKNIFVRSDGPSPTTPDAVTNTVWRCHPTLLEKVSD
jgi:hypothetical protein